MLHVQWLEADLGAGEAERNQLGRRMDLIAQAVLCLLRGRAVVAEAVGFDYEP